MTSIRFSAASGAACVGLRSAETPRLPRRPDSDILSVAIRAFFIGRNHQGFWIARDTEGATGGIFLLKSSALRFASKITWPTRCAFILLSERFELDVENTGNRLIRYLGPLKRLLQQAQRLVAVCR